MKDIYKEIALQAGGSHYPEVGGELLEKFADLLLKEVIKTVESTPKHCAYTTHDLGTVDCTIIKIVETVKDKFQL
jgi:hypothetical protein